MIETKRLCIRKFTANDSSDLYEYLSLPDTYLYEPGMPITKDEASALCAERSEGNSFYAVVLRESQKMIGHLYFSQTEPAKFMTWELGYIFNPGFTNLGYCTESAGAMLSYAFTVLGAHKAVAFCNPLNTASWRVLEKIGMRREGFFREKAYFREDENGNPLWHDCFAYGLTKGDFMGLTQSYFKDSQ